MTDRIGGASEPPDDAAGPPPAPPPPPPPPPPGWGPPSYAAPPGRGIDGMAIAALVLGIASLMFFFLVVPAILAIVFGAVSRRNIKTNPNKTGGGMATAGLVLGIISLVLTAIVFTVAAFDSDDGFDDDGLRYSRVQPGDCYEDPGSIVREVTLQPCSEEHDFEAIAALDHPASDDADYPGRDALRSYADEECTTRFAAYVGLPYEESELRIGYIVPSRDDWEDLDVRRIVCSVSNGDGGPLVGTVRNSAS